MGLSEPFDQMETPATGRVFQEGVCIQGPPQRGAFYPFGERPGSVQAPRKWLFALRSPTHPVLFLPQPSTADLGPARLDLTGCLLTCPESMGFWKSGLCTHPGSA